MYSPVGAQVAALLVHFSEQHTLHQWLLEQPIVDDDGGGGGVSVEQQTPPPPSVLGSVAVDVGVALAYLLCTATCPYTVAIPVFGVRRKPALPPTHFCLPLVTLIPILFAMGFNATAAVSM